MRSNASVIEIARDIMAAVHETTGTRGTGKVLIKPKTASTVYLPRNWHLYPMVNGAIREDLLFKIGQGPSRALYPNGKRKKANADEPDTESWWVIPPGGAIVNIHSVVGGIRHNLPKGTKFVFDPEHPNLEIETTLQTNITDAAEPTHFGGCKSIVQFEQLTAPTANLDAFRAAVGKFPAAVIVWDGSEPADGSTSSSLDRGASRAGSTTQLFKERFNIFVLSERLDSGATRSAEGLKLLDDLTFWLTDLQTIDGQVFSSPTGVQVRGRNRIAGDSAQYQSVFVYLLQISVTGTWKPYDFRSYSPWLKTHNVIKTHLKDESGEGKVTVDQDIDMTAVSE